MSTSSTLGTVSVLSRANRTLRPAQRSVGGPMFIAALMWCPMPASATDVAPVSAETVAELMTRDLIGVRGKEVLMITVTYVAGGASLPHRHDAQVFVYVLEGELTMQVKGGAPVTLRPGQTFYEGPSDIHQVSANASQTAPAKILVFMVKDKAKPASRDVAGKEAP
jgi:quercetin dioxygenase-like cupin family protein